MTRKRLPHFKELDGLRGLSTLAVFSHHFFTRVIHSTVIPEIAAFGRLGVQVFFVLSGFLITALLFIDRRKSSMIRNFYWKRVLRIWPALLIYLLLVAIGTPMSVRYIVCSLLFISNFEGMFGTYEMGPTWSLAIEEQFYLIWPQVLRGCKTNTVFLMSFIVFALSVSLRVLVPVLHHGSIALVYTPYQCDGLALGAMIACQWFAPHRLKGAAERIYRFLNGPAAVALWLAVLALEVVLYRTNQVNLSNGLQMTLITFATYRIIVLIVLKRSERAAWLGGAPLTFLGSISYGFYLYHGLVIEHLGVVDASRPLLLAGKLALGLAFSIVVSYLSLRFIELPIRKLRKHVLDAGLTPTLDETPA